MKYDHDQWVHCTYNLIASDFHRRKFTELLKYNCQVHNTADRIIQFFSATEISRIETFEILGPSPRR